MRASSKWKGSALLYVGLAGHTVLGQMVLPKIGNALLQAGKVPSRLEPPFTVTKTTWVIPTETRWVDERQVGCAPQPLEFCSDVSSSMFSLGSMTTIAPSPVPSPTATLGPETGPFAIEVQLMETVSELTRTQYLAISGDYVLLYPGPNIPGWFLDSDGNLIFDNTGLRLGVSPLDSPVSRKRMLQTGQNNNGYDTVIAGSVVAPPSAKVLTRWDGNLSISNTSLEIVDDSKNRINIGFMSCKLDVPDYGVQAWQLEAAYNVNQFLQGTETSGAVDPSLCISVRLLPVTHVPVSTAVSSHTSGYITRTSSTSMSITPSPTESTWNSFPILVDFDKTDFPDPEADYYILEYENGNGYVARSENPPYYHYDNATGFLTSHVTDEDLRFPVVDTPADAVASGSRVKSRRQDASEDDPPFRAILDGDSIIPAGDTIPFFVICSQNTTSDSEAHALVLAYNPEKYMEENDNCVAASLSLNRDAPILSTTTIPTTVTTTQTPFTTATAVSPNISGCNALNYTLAYSTTGLTNSFATACWCYSYLASTVSGTTIQDCTPTIYKVVPSITSISVTGVLSSTNPASGVARTDDEMINSRRLPRETVVPVNTTATTGTMISVTTSVSTDKDITVIPTPTEWFSMVEASPAYFTSYCASVFDDNGIEALTITSLSVISSTVGVTTISQTTVQTVCYQKVWEPVVTMSTPAIVICPASVTSV